MVARRRTASIMAKPPPIQMRGPPPNGKYAYLGTELGFDVWMLRQQIPRPRKGQRRGLVAGDEKGHGFVTQLSIGHPGAVDVLRVQQQRQQVIAPRPSGPRRRSRITR